MTAFVFSVGFLTFLAGVALFSVPAALIAGGFVVASMAASYAQGEDES